MGDDGRRTTGDGWRDDFGAICILHYAVRILQSPLRASALDSPRQLPDRSARCDTQLRGQDLLQPAVLPQCLTAPARAREQAEQLCLRLLAQRVGGDYLVRAVGSRFQRSTLRQEVR